MKERALIATGPEVRAFLEGRKTQVRVPVKPQPVGGDRIEADMAPGTEWVVGRFRDSENAWRYQPCPYQPGMRLWVRETWHPFHRVMRAECGVHYQADNTMAEIGAAADVEARPAGDKCDWRSAATMPRWASRLTLEVKAVRAERLHGIGSDGRHAKSVLAEGITEAAIEVQRQWFHQDDAPAIAFAQIWDARHGKRYPWASNCWTWVLSVGRVEGA